MLAEQPSAGELQAGVLLSVDDAAVCLSFATRQRVLSSAVLHGGMTQASAYLNLRVPREDEGVCEHPATTLARAVEARDLPLDTVGMMTAASMKSLRVSGEAIADEHLSVVVTAGMHNARRAGDRAEYRALGAVPREVGTINLAIVYSGALSPAAMVEAVTVATEAKAAALQDKGITSAVGAGIATGTGTDAVALFSADSGPEVPFVGKHTLFGERLAHLVITALTASLDWEEGAG